MFGIFAAFLALGQAALPPIPQAQRIEEARVVRVSPRPNFGSGVLAVYADFDVMRPDGTRLQLYLLWMGGSQYLPDLGSVCTITYRREALAPRNVHRPVGPHGDGGEGRLNVVHELSCGPPLELPSDYRSPSAW